MIHDIDYINSSLRLGDRFELPSGVVFTCHVTEFGKLVAIVSRGRKDLRLPNCFWGEIASQADLFIPGMENPKGPRGKQAFHITEVREIIYVPDTVPSFDQWRRFNDNCVWPPG